MKIRMGHVSNSSTTSFVIMGIYLSSSELEELNYFKNKFNQDDIEDEDINDYIYDEMYNLEGLDCYTFDGADGFYIGLDYDSINKDETLAEFKERVVKKIESNLGISQPSVSWHQEAYYN